MFTFGVGYDVNTALLDKIASVNGGVSDYVEPKEDLEIKVSSFFAKINYPVLTDLQLEMGGIETDLQYPRTLPDIFKGTQLSLIGRYRNQADLNNIRLRLTGRTNSREQNFYYDNQRFPLREEKNDFLPRLWATRRVGWLMEQVRTNGEQQELRDEIVDLGTRYGIVTPYTSYLAIEEDAPKDVLSVTDSNRVVNRPEARRGGVRDKSAPRPMSSAPPAKTTSAMSIDGASGAGAVMQSKKERVQREALRVDDEDSRSISARNVKGKTFYMRDGVWTDAEFKESARLPETTLVFGSDAYFALLKRLPRLADYFALGESVIVVDEGRVYRVGAATK